LRSKASARGAPLRHAEIEIDGRRVHVAVRTNARARRLTLRMAQGPAPGGGDGVTLTLPPGVGLDEGLAFVERSRGWIAQRLARLPEPVPFADGVSLPILGAEHLVKHAPWSRRLPWAEHGILWVGGRPEFLRRRVHDYLMAEARREIAQRARIKAARLPELVGAPKSRTGEARAATAESGALARWPQPDGWEGGWEGGWADPHGDLEDDLEPAPRHAARGSGAATAAFGDLFDRLDPRSRPAPFRPLGRIALRDTKSRWGSCSHKGDLNFSWRLVFAPLPVLDYVVAHEVAHLAHMDHSPAFWRLCDALTDTPGWPKTWLKRHGQGLLRYG
jgi:hypothetical protein